MQERQGGDALHGALLTLKDGLPLETSLIRETEFVKQAPQNRTVTLDLSRTLFIGYCHSAMHQLKLY